MNLTCYVVDDEYHSIDILVKYINKTAGLELMGSSVDPLVALNEVTGENPPAIIFLDVRMTELSGLEFAGMVNAFTKVVITTSFQEYALEAFEKEAVDFLLKPFSYERFLKCVQRIRKNVLVNSLPPIPPRSFFFVHTEVKGKIAKVIVDDILFIEGALNYVIIHLRNGKIMPYLTLSEIERLLPKNSFTRIHKSFIVKNNEVKFIEHGQVTLENNVHLPIGRSYKDRFLDDMKELVVISKRKL